MRLSEGDKICNFALAAQKEDADEIPEGEE
jgi:hypothetical protein